MADNNRTLKYTVELNVDYFKRRLEGIRTDIKGFEDTFKELNHSMSDFGSKAGFESAAGGAKRFAQAVREAGREAEKLSLGGKGIDEGFESLTQNMTALRTMLRELNKEKEVIMRGGQVVIADSNQTKTLDVVLSQIKAVKDEMQRIKNLDIDKILGAKAKAQFDEVTAAIRAQDSALKAYDRSLERHKALAQSTYGKYRSIVNSSNETLQKYGFETVENPFGKQGWTDYAKVIREQVAASESIRRNVAETRKGVEASVATQNGKYNGNAAFESAWKKVKDDAEKWGVAISRGKQLTDEELRAAQRVTNEYREQLRVLGGKKALSMAPVSPVLNYDNAVSFNKASTAARDSSALAQNLGNQTTEVRSYEQELRRLQSRCEALYATYRKAPTQENLRAFAETRNALRLTEKEYDRYQRSIQGASRTQSEFARKAMSHMQWITTGAAIGIAAGAPVALENEMSNIDYRMAGIRQVIPSIEANPHMKDSDPVGYANELEKMNQAMTDFIGIAGKYGQATDEVLDAAKSIGRMYGQGENGVINTKIFTDQAAKMAVADAFSMEEATKGLEAAMSQWNLQTEDTNDLITRSSEIIDIWTRAAHSGAASGQDISQAIQVAGASAAQAGISFSFFTSLVETGVRTTARSGNEIGQALKSLFVTMGSGKAEKALNLWGIKTKELGTDGKEHVRSLEQQILDVSLAVSSTEKDTTKFLSTLAGGKYQYSKISAILKNYKEILRMQGVLNDGKTKGFADEQVAVQLDTIKRKMEQAKAEAVNLIATLGQSGGFDGMKWLATQIRDIATGLRRLSEEAGKGQTNVLSLAKYLGYVVSGLVAIKAASAGIGKLIAAKEAMKTTWNMSEEYRKGGKVEGLFGDMYTDSKEAGRAKGAERAAVLGTGRNTQGINEETAALQTNSAAQGANTVQTDANTASKTANTAAERGNTASTGAASAAKATESNVTAGNTAQTTANTAAKTASAGASVRQAVAENATTGAIGRKTVAMRIGTAATTAFATAEKVATVASRTLSTAIAVLGGPMTIVATIAATLGADLLLSAMAEGEEANAASDAADALQRKIETAEQELDQTKRRETAALQVAEAYNKVKESLSTVSEGSEEYKAKQEQLKDMEETIAAILHTDAKQFIDDNGFKVGAIKEYMEKEKGKNVQEQKDNLSTAKANAEATKTQLSSLKARIEGLKQEIQQVKATGTAWGWLNTVINDTEYKTAVKGMETANKLLAMANTYHEDGRGVSGWLDDWTVDNLGGVDAVRAQASENYNQWAAKKDRAVSRAKENGNTDVLEQELAALEVKETDLESLLAQQEKTVEEAGVRLSNVETEASKTDSTATPDNNNYGKTKQSGKGHHGKTLIDYSQDELSAAIHEAAQSDIAQRYQFTEPLLRAIAARESGGDTTIRQYDANGNLLEDYAGSGHFGMFQVTRADAERFGTGDIAVPLNNAMTAVRLLAEKFDSTGELWKAVRAYNGGSDSYVAQVRKNYQAQKASFDFGKDDEFGLPGSFNDDVIAGVKAELGQAYGGSSWRDATQKVCTTLIQKALINAGVDEDTVNNLGAWAPDWSTNASYAFHPYSEVQSGAYIPKAGDIGLTNTDGSGKAGHVIMIGENGEGYYAAAGQGRKSAYYGTNWETAFASSGIEGVISVNELAGKPYTTSVRGGKKKPKSINDFQLDPYQEALWEEQRANERADIATWKAKSQDFLNGGTAGQDRVNLAVAELKLASQKVAKQILETSLDSTQKGIKAFLNTHKDIGEMLEKRGTTWEKLVPAEKKALADLAGVDSFKKQVDAEEKIRQKILQTTKAIEEQRQAWEKAAGYMNPDEMDKYLMEKMSTDYELAHPYGDDNPRGNREVLEAQRDILRDQLERRKAAALEAKKDGDIQRENKLTEYEAAVDKLEELKAKASSGSDKALTDEITKQETEVKRLGQEWKSLANVGTQAEQDTRKEVNETTRALTEKEKEIRKVELEFNKMILDGTVNMFSNVLTAGKSFSESFKELWADIGKFALQQLLKIQLQALFVRWGLKFAGGGDIPGRATGGSIPGYASGGQTAGAISGAGTATSDSILAYIGNKDRFVYLSNGEYVMTAEATQRIGKDNLDRMNYGKYATGGAISPTPYVPHISTNVTRRAEVLNRDNPNAKMESLMAQQTDLLRNMGKDGNSGGLVVLNTQASSEQVMKALSENPRALNAILGRNQRMGFR
ncbi:phage tail tape measure protein [Selenomonas ruminantium]|uniref:phage tail tape measure protein n=1 Tax=Selenomonas ruminantium TaxID=971 RepID=UPI0026EED42B|nr:phage tail tape measure protein [Selenomonas ruminantium]